MQKYPVTSRQNARSKTTRPSTVKRLGVSAAIATAIIGYALFRQNAGAASASAMSLSLDSVNDQNGASTNTTTAPQSPGATQGNLTDGKYDGTAVQAGPFGNVQVEITVANGKLSDIKIIDYPYHRSLSLRISQIALPMLMRESIQSQDARVNFISGATYTSYAFMQSMQAALDSASITTSTSNSL